MGSPQQIIDRYMTMREHVGDYQRQMFLVDHAGLPRKTVLEQIEILGTEIVPVLRRELDALRPAHVPDGPTHAGRVAARDAELAASGEPAYDDAYRFGTGDNWTGLTVEGGQRAQEQSLARDRRNQTRLEQSQAGKENK